ncbi:MAG: hypothetical protein JWO38_128 [Gemmataceae bacterium]|nr:hypothetical protein [Gemmataceae bacterium]
MTTTFGRISFALLIGAVVAGSAATQPPGAVMPAGQADPQPVPLVLSDQFDQKTDLAAHRGAVVILVYGDRKGTDACRALGAQLHVCWHPDAKGQPPAKAHAAPVVGLDGLQPGRESPDVRVVPVACCGKVPGPVRGAIRGQIAKGSPEVPVWLDFGDAMKTAFGLTPGEPNVVVFDAAGRLRMKVNGAPDQAALDRLVKAVQGLRYEAAK